MPHMLLMGDAKYRYSALLQINSHLSIFTDTEKNTNQHLLNVFASYNGYVKVKEGRCNI